MDDSRWNPEEKKKCGEKGKGVVFGFLRWFCPLDSMLDGKEFFSTKHKSRNHVSQHLHTFKRTLKENLDGSLLLRAPSPYFGCSMLPVRKVANYAYFSHPRSGRTKLLHFHLFVGTVSSFPIYFVHRHKYESFVAPSPATRGWCLKILDSPTKWNGSLNIFKHHDF